jgi:hypothetical protein
MPQATLQSTTTFISYLFHGVNPYSKPIPLKNGGIPANTQILRLLALDKVSGIIIEHIILLPEAPTRGRFFS